MVSDSERDAQYSARLRAWQVLNIKGLTESFQPTLLKYFNSVRENIQK
jgi:hypothetical protein